MLISFGGGKVKGFGGGFAAAEKLKGCGYVGGGKLEKLKPPVLVVAESFIVFLCFLIFFFFGT